MAPRMPLLPVPMERMNLQATNKDKHPGRVDLPEHPRRSREEVAQSRQEAEEARKTEEERVS